MSPALSSILQSVPKEVLPLLKRQFESWQQGTRVTLETIIHEARPEHRAIAVQALIKQEIVLREQSGERPDLNEYRSRFPEYTESLSQEWLTTAPNPITTNAEGLDQPTLDTLRDTQSQLFEATFISDAEVAMVKPPSSNPSAPTKAPGGSSGPRTLPSAAVGDAVNETIGMYRLTKKLGQGGMGAVYQAVHTKLDKIVAIKLLSRQDGVESTAVERFEREMKAVGKLEHPNVIRAMDAGEVDGIHFLVMEYVEGRDVSHVMKTRGRFKTEQACEIVRQAALGLHEAHSMGLVHRDIKPSNLFLTSKGVVKILDLGLARLAEGTYNHELTQSGQCMGTPDYMAPEQWTNARDVDGRTDLYALGCTLFHLIAGRPPFGTEEHESLGSKVLAHTSGPIPDIRTVRPDLPDEIHTILVRLLSKDRAQRPATGADLAQALLPFCQPLPGAEVKSSNDAPGTGKETAAPAPQPAKATSKKVALMIVASLATVAVLAFVLIRVRDKYGRVTEIKLPTGSSVELVNGKSGEGKQKPLAAISNKPDPTKPEAVSVEGQASVTVRPIPASELPEMQPGKGGSEPASRPAGTPPATPAEKVVAAAPSKLADEPLLDAPLAAEKPAPREPEPMPVVKEAGDKPAKAMPTEVALNTEPANPPAVEQLVPPVPLRLPLAPELIARQQAAWSRRMERPTTQANSIGITLVVIPPGEFEMGSTPDEQAGVAAQAISTGGAQQLVMSEAPRHHVKISRPFAMGQFEVTVGQFRQFVEATRYHTLAEREVATGLALGEGLTQKQRSRQATFSWQYAGDIRLDDEQPVCNLSWYDAVAFCEWLSQKEKQTYRLPTEAEWEYAARAGLGLTNVGGEEWQALMKQEGNLADVSAVREFGAAALTNPTVEWDDSFATVAPIGRFSPNVLGLQDLAGNVSELCSDRFAAEYYQGSPLENPRGPETGPYRVVRGASWQSSIADCRPGLRNFLAPRQAQLQVGFRLVLELPEPLEEGATVPVESPVARELRIAEWVLSQGGKVRVALGKQASNEIAKPSDLPKRDFTVLAISLADTGISDLGLQRLKGLTSLQELDLSVSAVTDLGLEALVPHKGLKKLNLSGTAVTGAGLVHVIAAKKLAELDLSRCPVTDAGLEPVKSLVSLNVLRLNSTSITDAGLEVLRALINLKELYVAETAVAGSGLMHLKRLESLALLDLSQTPIDNKQFKSIGELKKLRTLRLNWSTVGDLGVSNL